MVFIMTFKWRNLCFELLEAVIFPLSEVIFLIPESRNSFTDISLDKLRLLLGEIYTKVSKDLKVVRNGLPSLAIPPTKFESSWSESSPFLYSHLWNSQNVLLVD